MSGGDMLDASAVPTLSGAARSHHQQLPPTPQSASRAREFIRAHTGDDDVALLLTSELVTNAVLHARTELVLGVAVDGDTVLVTVGDHSTDEPVRPPTDHTRTSGRGMMLVESMARNWGVEQTDAGKVVWFTVERRSAETAGPDDD